jgi:hypothetical protein
VRQCGQQDAARNGPDELGICGSRSCRYLTAGSKQPTWWWICIPPGSSGT